MKLMKYLNSVDRALYIFMHYFNIFVTFGFFMRGMHCTERI